MSKLEIFYPTHFEKIYCHEDIAEIANRILQEYVEKNGVKVYGFADKCGWFRPDTMSNDNATHTAILINIEPTEKKKCTNQCAPEEYNQETKIGEIKCYNCGGKIQPTEWKEV